MNTIADGVSFDASVNSTGLTNLNVIAAGGTNNFTVGSDVAVSLAKTAIDQGATGAADINVVYSATATTASLTLNAVTSAGVDSSLGITGAKLTELDIVTTTAASVIQELEIGDNDAANSAKIATLVITGDQDLTITEGVDLLTSVANTITSTGLSGALNLGTGITALAAKQDLTFKAGNGVNTVTFADVDVDASITATFGSGKDVITLSNATGSVSIDTGAGNDTLTISELGSTFDTTDKETASFSLGLGDDTLVIATVLTQNNLDTGVTLAGGDGTDTLKINNAEYLALFNATSDVTVSGFEKLNAFDAGTYTLSKVSGLTSLDLSGAAAYTIAGMTATQANAVTVLADTTSESFALTDSSGTSDVLGITYAHATANTAITDAVTAAGFETVNVTNSNGTGTLGLSFGASASVTTLSLAGAGTGAATVDTANLSGLTSFTAANAKGTVALTTAATQVGTFTLSAQNDTVALTANTGAATFSLGDGNDKLTGLQADISALTSLDGGAGNDTLVISDTVASAATLTIADGTFANTSSFKTVDLSGSLGSIVWTLGGYANALAAANSGTLYITGTTTLGTADADGYTLNSASLALANGINLTLADTAKDATKTAAISVTTNAAADTLSITESKAASVATITVSAGNGANSVTTSHAGTGATSVTTGTGVDTISVTSAATAAGNVAIISGAGADTITVVNAATAGAAAVNVVTAGTGADSITITGATGNKAAKSVNSIVIAEGDSLTTTTGYDTVTGFYVGAADTRLSDTINFAGNSAVQGNATLDGTNFNTIKSSVVASGVVTFDDADTFAAAVVVNASNLADVLGYIDANYTTAQNVVAFAYDSDASGTADATFVYQVGTTTDSLVLLAGVTGVTSITTTAVVTANTLNVA